MTISAPQKVEYKVEVNFTDTATISVVAPEGMSKEELLTHINSNRDQYRWNIEMVEGYGWGFIDCLMDGSTPEEVFVEVNEDYEEEE